MNQQTSYPCECGLDYDEAAARAACRAIGHRVAELAGAVAHRPGEGIPLAGDIDGLADRIEANVEAIARAMWDLHVKHYESVGYHGWFKAWEKEREFFRKHWRDQARLALQLSLAAFRGDPR